MYWEETAELYVYAGNKTYRDIEMLDNMQRKVMYMKRWQEKKKEKNQ